MAPLPRALRTTLRGRRLGSPRRDRRLRSVGRGRSCALLGAALICAGLAGATICAAENQLAVIGFELCDLDADGLIGPEDGKRAVDYEFCIPAGDGFVDEVRSIDVSARFHAESPGRIGCDQDQVLVLGNTHRPDFAFVLQRLADLPYVERIEQAFFE
jgi:hypothetical protein